METPGTPITGSGATGIEAEIAGQATVDSAPSERDSKDAENGLDANAEDGVHLPGPLVDLDAGSEAGTG